MASTSEKDAQRNSIASGDAVEALLLFGALMMRAGNTAARTREWIEEIARTMGFHSISLSLSTDSITASVRRSGEKITIMREIGLPGINASRIAELEQLARTMGSESAPREIAAKLRGNRINGTPIFQDANCGRCRHGKRCLCLS